jgi:hypothetical protein
MRSVHDSLVMLSAAGSTGYRVSPNTRTLHSVRVWGRLHPQWAHRLAVGLSRLGISILSGFARRDGDGSWAAEFLVAPTPGAADPMSVDYLLLTREAPPLDLPPVALDDYSLDGAPERGGVLDLEVRGPDRIGFLGSLLRTLNDLSLVPHEMAIVTREGEARDRFALRSLQGQVPSDATRRALDAVLAGQRAQTGAAARAACPPPS